MSQEQEPYGKTEESFVNQMVDEKRAADILNRFTYHAPVGNQPELYAEIRKRALKYAQFLEAVCPESREQSLAITKLEEAVFWANAALARRQ